MFRIQQIQLDAFTIVAERVPFISGKWREDVSSQLLEVAQHCAKGIQTASKSSQLAPALKALSAVVQSSIETEKSYLAEFTGPILKVANDFRGEIPITESSLGLLTSMM